MGQGRRLERLDDQSSEIDKDADGEGEHSILHRWYTA